VTQPLGSKSLLKIKELIFFIQEIKIASDDLQLVHFRNTNLKTIDHTLRNKPSLINSVNSINQLADLIPSSCIVINSPCWGAVPSQASLKVTFSIALVT